MRQRQKGYRKQRQARRRAGKEEKIRVKLQFIKLWENEQDHI